ncbi:MAG: hypothetical protein MMC33_010910 [Icmadophila ericetorum]|nr:hypothetical protein [Icmadophila ericetorum]
MLFELSPSSFKPKRLLQVLMPDETLNLIAKWGNHITDTKSLRQWSGQWPESDRYCTDIIAVVTIPAGWTRLTDNEGTALWKAQNGRKKRKVPPTPDSDDEFQAERNAWLSMKGYSNIHKRPRANAKPKTQRTQDSTQLQKSQLQQESQFQLVQPQPDVSRSQLEIGQSQSDIGQAHSNIGQSQLIGEIQEQTQSHNQESNQTLGQLKKQWQSQEKSREILDRPVYRPALATLDGNIRPASRLGRRQNRHPPKRYRD